MTIEVTAEEAPGLREWPLIGSALTFGQDRVGLLERVVAECGDIGRFRLGRFPIYVMNRADLVHQVLVARADAFDKGDLLRKANRPVLGDGLLLSEGATWRRQRKILTPAFEPRRIAAYADTMVAYAERAPSAWPDGAVIDIAQEMTRLTMRIIGKLLFDADDFDETDELGAAIAHAAQWIDNALSHSFGPPFGWPTAANRAGRAALRLIERRVQGLIDVRRYRSNDRIDLLTMLLRAHDGDGSTMSDQQVRDETLTLFLAGQETTASALSWAWYLLASHPAVYARLQAEVDGVLHGRAPAYDDLAHLPYTLQVFKETLRLYPPVYLIHRQALHDVEIDGYRIRRGEGVVLSTYTIHRRPDYYPEPERFDPERWTPENEQQLPRYAYLPFGAGARICLGNHFAQMEGQLLLASLAQRVHFALAPGQQILPLAAANLKQREGCRVLVAHRVAGVDGGVRDAEYALARSA